MTMWIIIMWTVIACVIAAMFYLGARIPLFFSADTIGTWTKFKQFCFGFLITFGLTGVIALCIDFVNAIVCVIYFAMVWVVSDFMFWIIEKIGHVTFEHYYAGWVAILITTIALAFGWYLDHHVWQKNYEITTFKDIPHLRVAMFADSHIGTTFKGHKFAQHLEKIQAQNPDVVVVVGDYVDDGTKKEDMIVATKALGKMKTKYGVYFVFGNHDKGYYGAEHRGFSAQELINEMRKNNITVLRDEAVLIGDAFYVIGRRDFSEFKEQGRNRRSMDELIKNLDKNKYMIVLDHQPADFDNQAKAEVDLVLCGHTHGGQLFPFNQVGRWIKANDLIYGHERRNKTDFIVTSGISDWAIKFKTGTKSEYVIIDLTKGK